MVVVSSGIDRCGISNGIEKTKRYRAQRTTGFTMGPHSAGAAARDAGRVTCAGASVVLMARGPSPVARASRRGQDGSVIPVAMRGATVRLRRGAAGRPRRDRKSVV